MLPFRDRKDAGQQLAQALKEYANKPNTIVIALPRGGVVVGYEVAQSLKVPLDIVCPRKIGAPLNPEFAIGAITETGEAILSDSVIQDYHISQEYLTQAMDEEKQKAKWRLDHYRMRRPRRDLAGKTVILVDDGLATGSTMRAAIKTVRAEKAHEVIMAIPIAPPDTFTRLEQEVDKAIALATPPMFYAVGQFYQLFDQTTDEEVIHLLSLSSFLV